MESNYSWYYRRNYRVASISSTGHLILVDEFIKLDLSKDFMEMFNVVIQLGAIMAVVILYFHKLNPFSPKKMAKRKRYLDSLV